MVLIAWLHNTSKALPVPLHVYSIIMALLAMPYGHMALWFQVTLRHLIVGPSQLTQLYLDFLGVPPYVNYQAINRLKSGFSLPIMALSPCFNLYLHFYSVVL